MNQLRHIDAIRSDIADFETRKDIVAPIISFISDGLQDSDFADIADLRLEEDIKTVMIFDLTIDGDHDYDGLMDVPIVAAAQIKGLPSKTSQYLRAKLKISVE